jgi:hypothetical protein
VRLADGDPASDVLVSQDVFLPQTVPASLANDLAGLARQARTAGSALKIALISAPNDLGSITSLYGRPTAYARFLSLELQFVTKAPLLVVMPQGLALARAGQLLSSKRIAGIAITPGPAGLAAAARTAVERLVPGLSRPQPSTRSRRTAPQPKTQSRPQPPPAARAFTGAPTQGPSGSLIGSILDRFQRGAQQPVVWLALAIALAFIAVVGGMVYLLASGTLEVPWSRQRSR